LLRNPNEIQCELPTVERSCLIFVTNTWSVP
jgi:hypothetical protein